jgi:hypothetical protein
MATLIKTYSAPVGSKKQALLKQRYNRLMTQLNFGYFGFISLVIAISACLGGVVVKFSLEYNSVLWQFVLGMCLSLANIVACVAQVPVRWVFAVFVTTTLANISLILISVFL